MTFDYIVSTFMEECGELTQALGKSIRFGMDSKKPSTGELNVDQIHDEFHDVMACYMILSEYSEKNDNVPLFPEICFDHIGKKKERMKKYYEMSRQNPNNQPLVIKLYKVKHQINIPLKKDGGLTAMPLEVGDMLINVNGVISFKHEDDRMTPLLIAEEFVDKNTADFFIKI